MLPVQEPKDLPRDPIHWAAGAKAQLEACQDIGQVREMAAQAQGILAYLNAKLGRASEEARAVAELEVLTRRRIGELLPAKPSAKAAGKRGGRGRKGAEPRHPLDHRRASEARKLAEVPQADLDAYLAEQRDAGKPPSVAGALKASAPPAGAPPAGGWEHAYEVGVELESRISKALAYAADHLDDSPPELGKALKDTHRSLCEAVRSISGLVFRASRKAKQ